MKLPYGYVLIGGEIVVHEEKADVMAAPNKGNFCGVRNPGRCCFGRVYRGFHLCGF